MLLVASINGVVIPSTLSANLPISIILVFFFLIGKYMFLVTNKFRMVTLPTKGTNYINAISIEVDMVDIGNQNIANKLAFLLDNEGEVHEITHYCTDLSNHAIIASCFFLVIKRQNMYTWFCKRKQG